MVKLVIPAETFIVNHLFTDAEFFLEQAKELREKDAHGARRYIRGVAQTLFAYNRSINPRVAHTLPCMYATRGIALATPRSGVCR